MRILGIHTKHFRFESKEKAMEGAEIISEEKHRKNIERECLVIFISVEKEDRKNPSSVASQVVSDTLKRGKQLGVNVAVVYPYVHLTEEPSSAGIALQVLKK